MNVSKKYCFGMSNKTGTQNKKNVLSPCQWFYTIALINRKLCSNVPTKAVRKKNTKTETWMVVGLGDMTKNVIIINFFISADINNYRDKCQIIISFKFQV